VWRGVIGEKYSISVGLIGKVNERAKIWWVKKGKKKDREKRLRGKKRTWFGLLPPRSQTACGETKGSKRI